MGQTCPTHFFKTVNLSPLPHKHNQILLNSRILPSIFENEPTLLGRREEKDLMGVYMWGAGEASKLPKMDQSAPNLTFNKQMTWPQQTVWLHGRWAAPLCLQL